MTRLLTAAGLVLLLVGCGAGPEGHEQATEPFAADTVAVLCCSQAGELTAELAVKPGMYPRVLCGGRTGVWRCEGPDGNRWTSYRLRSGAGGAQSLEQGPSIESDSAAQDSVFSFTPTGRYEYTHNHGCTQEDHLRELAWPEEAGGWVEKEADWIVYKWDPEEGAWVGDDCRTKAPEHPDEP